MLSTKTLLTAATICFLLALAVPTAAITVGEDPASDDVVLEPADNRYATLEDGELELDLAAVVNTETTFANVFTVTVGEDADDLEEIWIDHDVDGVTFYTEEGEVTADSRLEPAPGDTVTVGVVVDTRVASAGTETFTVHVRYEDEAEPDDGDEGSDDGSEAPPSQIGLESVTVEPTTVETNETVTVTATYRNTGETAGEETVALTVDGVVVDTQTITVGPSETVSATFERQLQWAGSYAVGIEGGPTEHVTVEGPSIEVTAASVTTTELSTNEQGTVEATITNPTQTAADRTLELTVDGIVVDTRAVTVEPNAERTVSFTPQFGQPGTYEIGVSGVEAGTITVEEPEPAIVQNRDISAAATVAVAPPVTAGFLFLAAAANRRWALISRKP